MPSPPSAAPAAARAVASRVLPVLLAAALVACGSGATTAPSGAATTSPSSAATSTSAGAGGDAEQEHSPAPGVVEGVGPEELGEGVVLDVSLLADGGPFDPDLDTVFTVVFDIDGLGGEAILEVEHEVDLIITTLTGDTSVLLRPDDEPGSSRVIVNRDLGVPELGPHTLTYSGVLEVADGSFELPFERVIRFVTTEIGEAPVESIELVGGAVAVEASRRWRVVAPVLSFTRQLERTALDGLEGPIGLDLSETEVLVDLVARDLRVVSVRRSLRPLFLDDLDVLARGLPETFGPGEYADPVPIELGGLSGLRVVRTSSGVTQTIDLLTTDDEVFIVQAGHRGDPDHAAEVAAVRDSLRFRPEEFDRLTHAIEQEIWLTFEGERYFQIDTRVPADWEIDPEEPARLTSPDGGQRLVRQSFPVGDGTIEGFVEQIVEQNVPDGAEATVEFGERGGLGSATISIVGDPDGDAIVVVITDGATLEVTTARDDPDDPDPSLIAAIAASIRPVGPPSTN